MVIMEDFENSLNYVSQIDNAYTEENQELIINSITLENSDGKTQELAQQLTNLNNLLIIIQDGKEKINQLMEKIQQKKTQLVEQAKIELAKLQAQAKSNSCCKTIDELCGKLANPNQVTILNRIITDKEYSKIYLSGYEPNANRTGKNSDLIGTVKVLGTYNEKKACREEYEIKLLATSPKGMFWCSCADHKFNSTKKNIVCKHICFLICKIAKLLKPEVFDNKKFSDQDLAVLLAKLTAKGDGDIWSDKTVAKILGKITLETFKQFVKAIEDCCPVCFNDLEPADKPNLLACPTCKNYIHEECADIWLEQKQSCAMCKSDFWKYYGKVKAGGSVSITK
jgi:hypothetical protein